MKKLTLMVLCASVGFGASAQNTLSKKEQKQGWTLLFDGKSFANWHGYLQQGVGEAWSIQDGTMMFDGAARKQGKKGGDIVTNEEYESFELAVDWKISEGGNSGIFWAVKEEPKYNVPYLTGPEMQVLDDAKHPDAKAGKNGNHKAGALYDMIPPAKLDAVKPAGEWNTAKMRIDQAKGEGVFWLNGVEVVTFKTKGPEWEALVNNSKFKGWTGFAKFSKGRIGLQDHGDTVWFRNIKIRKL